MKFNKKKIHNIGIYFDKLSKKNGEKIALKFSKREKFSFKFLNKLSNKFFIYFDSINLRENDLIAIESKKNIYSYAMIIAALKKGIAYSFFDTSESERRAKLILKKLKPKKIFLFDDKKGFLKSTIISK